MEQVEELACANEEFKFGGSGLNDERQSKSKGGIFGGLFGASKSSKQSANMSKAPMSMAKKSKMSDGLANNLYKAQRNKKK